MYRDCLECGSQCCKFLCVPVEYQNVLRTTGVPLALYRSELDQDPRRYFEIHEGVMVSGDCFTIAKNIPTHLKETRLGTFIVISSTCRKLSTGGLCSIYSLRPDMCRNFVVSTAGNYCVPKGCIYDTEGEFGEDYGVPLTASPTTPKRL